jgi:hypothetical protein
MISPWGLFRGFGMVENILGLKKILFLKAKLSVGFGLSLNSVAEKEIDEISSEILSEIEKSSSKQLADSEEIQKILHLTDRRSPCQKTVAAHGKCFYQQRTRRRQKGGY